MIVSGGLNVYAKEVELVLVTHPDIADAAVVGRPDEQFGESVVAFVQLQSPSARSRKMKLFIFAKSDWRAIRSRAKCCLSMNSLVL